MAQKPTRQTVGTTLGILAIVFWSTTIAFSRSLIEQLGTITAATCIYLLSGILGCCHLLIVREGMRKVAQLPRRYLLGCGAMFVLYSVMLYLAIGLARGRQQAIEVGIINYLWPGLTLVFSIPVLGHKGRLWLIPGILLAFGGVILATMQGKSYSTDVLLDNLRHNSIPYLLALAAAVTWGLYSNFSRRWAGTAEGGAIPLFTLAVGFILLLVRLGVQEEAQWSARSLLELLFVAAFPGLIAYIFWDLAMRRGRMILVASLSYFIPLISTMISCVYLDVPMGLNLWLGCALVVGGAILCNWSVRENTSGTAKTAALR